jgi:hypothetical protein
LAPTAKDEGRPYRFTTVYRLLTDFEAEVERVLAERGVGRTVVGDSDAAHRSKR